MKLPLIGMTIGDASGVGPEILVKALADRRVLEAMRPVVVGDRVVLEEAMSGCGVGFALVEVEAPSASSPDGVIQLVDLGRIEAPVEFGHVRADYGAAAVAYIERVVELAQAGAIDGIVTGPINKEALRASGAPFPGHTEMLASLFGVGADDVFTMFTVQELRIFFLTRHHALRDAIDLIDEERVYAGLVRVEQLMAEMGQSNPRIALAALNPHAGDGGLMGTEDDEILVPAMSRARERGIDGYGPVPADSVFAHCRAGRYDCVISLYHDQGHIAAKTLDFFGTVSSTLGLPVIRTAAEHGTAFDIAGKWVADADGQVAAMLEAARVVEARKAAGSPG